jgi:hypothetical protein
MIPAEENQRTRGNVCACNTPSTTNPSWTDTDVNPDLSGERPTTSRLSHGKTIVVDRCRVRQEAFSEDFICSSRTDADIWLRNIATKTKDAINT